MCFAQGHPFNLMIFNQPLSVKRTVHIIHVDVLPIHSLLCKRQNLMVPATPTQWYAHDTLDVLRYIPTTQCFTQGTHNVMRYIHPLRARRTWRDDVHTTHSELGAHGVTTYTPPTQRFTHGTHDLIMRTSTHSVIQTRYT